MPAERKETRPKTLLDAYNDGIGDGLVFATAIMGSSSAKTIKELRADVQAKRAVLRPLSRTGERENE